MATLLNTIHDDETRTICRQYNDKPDELIEVLHAVQAAQGFLTDKALRTIADALNISRAEVHGVVTFYHDFKREKSAAQTIKICRAEACQAVGADDLIQSAEQHFKTKLDAKSVAVKLEATYCLGNCALGPAVMIDEQLYGRVDIQRLTALSKAHSGDRG